MVSEMSCSDAEPFERTRGKQSGVVVFLVWAACVVWSRRATTAHRLSVDGSGPVASASVFVPTPAFR